MLNLAFMGLYKKIVEVVMVDSLLRRPKVEALTGLSRSSIYAAMLRGEFPRPVRIGRRAVAWPKAAIEDWIEARKAESGINAEI